MEKGKVCTWRLFLVLITAIPHCGNNPIIVPVTPSLTSVNWDTTFSISGNTFPDAAVNARSVVSAGNQERFKWLYARLLQADTLGIGVIGGSITQGALASLPGNSYASRLCEFLTKNFPGKCFSLINAGIGATNSRFGCSRIQDDLLIEDPDLVIVEFAVNDAPSDSISYEGLVRQCLQHISGPVILLFTMNETGDSTNQRIQSGIGIHYGLPMISYRDALWPLVAANELPWNSIAADAVHPNDNGHLLCSQLLFSFLTHSLLNLPDSEPAIQDVRAPAIDDFYEHAGIHDTTGSHVTAVAMGGWQRMVDELGRVGYKSTNLNDTMTLVSTAREMTIGYWYSVDQNANLKVRADGIEIGVIHNHFADDWGGGYMPLFKVYCNPNLRQNHIVEFIKCGGDAFTIPYVLFVE